MRFGKDNCGWLKCNTDPENTASISALQEQVLRQNLRRR